MCGLSYAQLPVTLGVLEGHLLFGTFLTPAPRDMLHLLSMTWRKTFWWCCLS